MQNLLLIGVLVNTNEISEEGEAKPPNFRKTPVKRKKVAMYIQIQTYMAAFAHNMYRNVSLQGSNPFPYGNMRFGIFFGVTLQKSILCSNYLAS